MQGIAEVLDKRKDYKMKKPLNELGLTELQTTFLKNLDKDEEFSSYGLKTEVWTDYYATTLEMSGIMNKMQSGACMTTLHQKDFIRVGKMKRGKETAKYLRLTNKGVEVISKLIDLSKFTFVEKPEMTDEPVEEVKDNKPKHWEEEDPDDANIEQRPIQVNDLVKCTEFDGRIKFRVQKIYDDNRVNIAHAKRGSFTVQMDTLRLTSSPVFNI